MLPQTNNLLLLQDLGDSSRTTKLAASDLNALRTVADWITSFVAKPNKDLGRAGPVCPFVGGALERKTLWLAPETIATDDVSAVVELIDGYKTLLLAAQPTEGDDAQFKAIVVVFAGLSADRAKQYADDVQIQHLQRQSYAEDGVVLGEFHAMNDVTAIYNRGFQPFKSPAPFWLVRNAVISDWTFYVSNEDWLGIWARRFGESAVQALAEELRRTGWPRRES